MLGGSDLNLTLKRSAAKAAGIKTAAEKVKWGKEKIEERRFGSTEAERR
jgi:hypothetical protein